MKGQTSIFFINLGAAWVQYCKSQVLHSCLSLLVASGEIRGPHFFYSRPYRRSRDKTGEYYRTTLVREPHLMFRPHWNWGWFWGYSKPPTSMGSVRALPEQSQWLIYFGTQQVSDMVQVWEEFWSGNRPSSMRESSVKSWLLPLAAIPPPLHCLPQLSTGTTLGCPCLSENLAAASCIEVIHQVTLLKLLNTTFPKGKKPLCF